MNANLYLEKEPASTQLLVRALLRVEGAAPAEGDRAPLNLSLVLDRSGSMDGEKLDAVKRAAALVVRRLAPRDTISVVIYDDEVETLVPAVAGGEPTAMLARIRGIRAGGTTNLSGGWMRGHDVVRAHLRNGARSTARCCCIRIPAWRGRSG